MAIHSTIITNQKQIAQNTLEISFKRPDNFSFKAGQYIQVDIPKLLHSDHKGSSRVFSIASTPLDQEEVSVAFRDTGSGFKRTLAGLPIGAPIRIEGPHGFYTFPENPTESIVFIAGGIGIVPYLSMIRHSVESKNQFPFSITLLYTNRNKENTPYHRELKDISRGENNFVLKSRFNRIDAQFIRKNITGIDKCRWYIAGPPQMVAHAKDLLLQIGVDTAKIHSEEFTGY